MCRYHLLLKVALHDCLEVIVRKMFQFGRCATVQADKKIIAQHGRYRDSNAYGCGYQRLANRSRHHIQAGRTFSLRTCCFRALSSNSCQAVYWSVRKTGWLGIFAITFWPAW
jgi:hypothetical protein